MDRRRAPLAGRPWRLRRPWRLGRAVPLLAGTGLAAVMVAGCTSSGSAVPDYRASPGGSVIEHSPGIRIEPILPVPSPGPGTKGAGGSGGAGPSRGSDKATDPFVVATRLTTPTAVTIMPDGTALVGERTTGRIRRVQPRPDKPTPVVKTLHGLDTSGGGGLLDLAVSPSYSEDSLIYAYVTTPTDNRVVAFTLDGPVTPVITGIPKGASGNAGRIEFERSGRLRVATGDAGRPALTQASRSLAGKVLRINDIGRPAAGNPNPSSPVYARGLQGLGGICGIPGTPTELEVQTTPGGRGEINLIKADGDVAASGPVAEVPARYGAVGDCTVSNGRIWISSLDGQSLLWASLTGKAATPGIGPFRAVLTQRYGRLLTAVAAPDGAIWLTTANRDGGSPKPVDERVIRYVPSGGSAGRPV